MPLDPERDHETTNPMTQPPPQPDDRILVYSDESAHQSFPARALASSEIPVEFFEDLRALRSAAGENVSALAVACSDDGLLDDLARTVDQTIQLWEVPIYVCAREMPERLAARPNVTRVDPSTSEHMLRSAVEGALRERRRQAYLNQVLDSLRQVEEREERLLAEIGHELRNPLAVLATSVSVIRQEHQEDEELAQRLETMERQVHALTRRVDQMLDTSRGTSEFSDSREWPPESAGQKKKRRAPGAALEAAKSRHHRGGAVLVVEDHHDGRALMVELLRMWGYTVEGASDGLEGVEVARRLHPDIALVDIDLPEIDGYEVARRIRDERGDEPIHLIAMSGFGQPEDRLRALAAGFDRHLVKPVDSVRLANLLEETLAGDGESAARET